MPTNRRLGWVATALLLGAILAAEAGLAKDNTTSEKSSVVKERTQEKDGKKKGRKTQKEPASEKGPREIAITLDDAPRGTTSLLVEGERSKLLLQNLKKVDAPPVLFFANSAQFEKDKVGPAGKERLRRYARAGNLIGNHTHSHPDFNETSAVDYTADIREGQKKLRAMRGFVGYFRFPYLREGDTVEKMAAARAQLKKSKLKNGYVTVNTYDWSIDSQVQSAMDALLPIDMEALKKVYLGILLNDLEHYDRLAVEVLGRSPKHVLLLHENDLSALFIGDLIETLRLHGWKIISAREAYEDDIANYISKTPAKFNPGRIGEIARDRGIGPRSRLWSSTCDEAEIAKRLKAAKVF